MQKKMTSLSPQRRRNAVLLALLLLGAGLTCSAQKLAVKNNLLYDLTQTPNIGFELAVSHKWTVGINFGYNPWWHHADGGHTFPFGKGTARAADDRVQWRHFIIAPEARY